MYAMSTGKYHETLRRLHDEYGVNVRIGELFDLILFGQRSGIETLLLRRTKRNLNHRRQRRLVCPWRGRDA